MAIVQRNDGYSAMQGDNTVREAIPVFDIAGGNLYPVASVPLIAGSGNVANATAAATLTGTATTTVYLAGFEITGAGATAGLPVTVTVSGILGGTRSYTYVFATGATVANNTLGIQFVPPIPASAVNTPIVVSCPAGGAGNTNNTAVAHGFYK